MFLMVPSGLLENRRGGDGEAESDCVLTRGRVSGDALTVAVGNPWIVCLQRWRQSDPERGEICQK